MRLSSLPVQGIHIMAAITMLLVIAAYGSLIRALSDRHDRRWLLVAALCTLPLHPLAFYWVRSPLNNWLLTVLDANSGLYQFIAFLYAPLTEEPAKLLPLMIPALRQRITPQTFILFGLSLGLGFGIGEIWFLADRFAQVPSLATLPFYQFTGFLQERFLVCFLHGAFSAIALRWLPTRLFLGLLAAMALHWLLNAPIFLGVQNVGGIGRANWLLLLSLWVLVYSVGMAVWLGWWRWGRAFPRAMTHALCPECHQVYRRPLLGANLGFKRYERCSHCQKFHWVDMRALLDEPPDDRSL